jgi:mRNA interferase MazF
LVYYQNPNDIIERLTKENIKLKQQLNMVNPKMQVKRGDIAFAKMTSNFVSNSGETQFSRPYLIISNDVGNENSTICIGIPMTSKVKKMSQPTHIRLSYHDSILLCEQMKTINQEDITNINYHLRDEEMAEVEKCIKISLNLK